MFEANYKQNDDGNKLEVTGCKNQQSLGRNTRRRRQAKVLLYKNFFCSKKLNFKIKNHRCPKSQQVECLNVGSSWFDIV
jgi:hypothetical protein